MNFSINTIFLLFFANYVKLEENSTLLLLQIVHRHGDRTPISFYKNDPYKGEDQWFDGLGELTPRGKHRMYSFGQDLRKRYSHYLGDSPKNIYLRSSASDRCIESASALVSGLYPPKNRWIWSKDLIAHFWQPIAIQTVLKSSDGLLVPNSDCPAADAAYEQTMRSKEVQQFLDSQKDFIKKVEEKTGEKYTKLRQLDYLFDTLKAETTFDEPKPVPKWVHELGNDTLERLEEFERKAFKYDWSSKTVQRLRAGLILKELTNNMEKAIKGEKNLKKVYSYASHDTLIVVILQALGLYNDIPPSYGSALLFELHEINGQHFLHLVYANVTPTLNYKELELNNCRLDNQTKQKCGFTQFVDSVHQFIPNDWHKECQLPALRETYALHNKVVVERVDNTQDNPVQCSNSGSGFLLAVGFITGFVTLLFFLLIKKIFERFVPLNKSRYFDNSYSVNSLHKNNQIIEKIIKI